MNIFPVRQDSTAKYTAVLKDENGDPVSNTALSAFTLTLYNRNDPDLAILNARNNQNVLNANDVQIDSGGNLAWTLQPADNVIQDEAKVYEDHIALFKFEWQGGAKRGYHEVTIRVTNLARVP